MVRSRQATPWYRWLKWGDYLIYILITVSAVALFFQGPAFLQPVIGGEAQVSIDGQVVKTINAGDLAQSGQFTLEANGFHYTVEYDGGKIRISKADCPDQVCVQTGWVSRLGQVAACVPGHLILSVTSNPADSGSKETTEEVDVVVR